MTGTSVFSLLGKLAIDGVDESKKALNDVSKSGEETKNKLNVSLKDIGEKAGELGRSMAKGLSIGLTAITASYEATKEFRMDLGRLEAGYEGVGLSGDTANKVFKDFYGILGETDTAVEASNLLKELAQDEQGLAEWTSIATGVYARFPDSIPIEALIESANETAKVGQITGNLADALNWAGVSEEQFNAKLEKCNTEAEREKLIRDTLNGLYKDSANEYQKNNKGLIDNNKAQADLNMKMAETMEKVEPLITQGKIFIAEVLMKLQPLITWVIDNFDLIAPIILTIVGALTLFSTTMSIVNAVMMASPVTWIVLAIVAALAALVAIIVLVVKHWDKIKETASNVWTAIQEIWGTVAEWFNTYVVQPIISFFTGLWEGLKVIWDGIVGAIKFAFDLIVAIITAYFQIITLPFRFIWENCKDIIINVFNTIKDFITNVINTIKNVIVTVFTAIRNFFSTIWNGVKSVFTTVWNAIVNFLKPILETIKNVISTVFNAVKNTITNIWNGIKNTVSNVVNGIKDTISNVFNKVKDTVTSVFNKVKTAITSPIEKARDVVKGVVDKIKSFFKFNVSLPKIKLPHFGITPKGWQIGDLLKGKIPKLGIDWYAKAVRSPMLLENPTAFGISPNGNLRVGGEAGSELVGGTSTIMGMIANAVSSNNGGMENKLDILINLLTNYLPTLGNQQVVLSTGELVGAMVNPMDKALGQLADNRRRGR